MVNKIAISPEKTHSTCSKKRKVVERGQKQKESRGLYFIAFVKHFFPKCLTCPVNSLKKKGQTQGKISCNFLY